MKDKMVLSCLCSRSQQERFKCLRQFEKMYSEKTVKQNEETASKEKISS